MRLSLYWASAENTGFRILDQLIVLVGVVSIPSAFEDGVAGRRVLRPMSKVDAGRN